MSYLCSTCLSETLTRICPNCNPSEDSLRCEFHKKSTAAGPQCPKCEEVRGNRATLTDVLLYEAGKEEGKAEIARLRAALEAVEWSRTGWQCCPWCNSWPTHGHKEDCPRQKALGL